jgi:small subunit ribosomal protein S9
MATTATERTYATGKKKNAIARVYMSKGTGKITINKQEIDDYLRRPILKMIVMQPLKLVDMEGKFDFYVNALGGGLAGQAGAIKHGISKALQIFDPELRGKLKAAGFLTRDPRVVERKKYGQSGARKKYQFSKR